MNDESGLRRPIGWWLKEADTQLDAAFDRALQGRNVDRRRWQVLASLAKNPTPRSELIETLASFDPQAAVDAAIDDLATRGWIDGAAEVLTLTSNGRREHDVLAPLIDNVRQQVTAALPHDDYVTLVRLLQRLVTGLAPDHGHVTEESSLK